MASMPAQPLEERHGAGQGEDRRDAARPCLLDQPAHDQPADTVAAVGRQHRQRAHRAARGRAGLALCLSFFAHFVGAVFGTLLLTFFAPVVASFALRFGPPETFGVMLLTFSSFVGLGGKEPMKTLVATALGFIMAAVEMEDAQKNGRIA